MIMITLLRGHFKLEVNFRKCYLLRNDVSNFCEQSHLVRTRDDMQ